MGRNVLLSTDVYKMGHMEQYAPGTERVYSYLCARSNKEFDECLFFGLQYYLRQYFSKAVTHDEAEEFIRIRSQILGTARSREIGKKVHDLADLGYWPIKIKAIPEGTVLPTRNALLTIESTHPDFYWAVGFIESLLLKVWYPTVVATNSYSYWKLLQSKTKAPVEVRQFLIHDFGYRSDSSEESAAISGAAHLICFRGSDTVVALPLIRDYYWPEPNYTMGSVPATEHSVMCSYGVNGEEEAFERMLELYPAGYLSIVSDTYDIYHVCTDILPGLKDKIMARNGKVVIRPDSGYPPNVICGDPNALTLPEQKGVLRLLAETFGTTTNDEGLKVLDSHIGLIYGDGMYRQRYEETLDRMKAMGFDASNLVIGVGGILRMGTRDTLGLALKATQITRNGKIVDIQKHPVTDKAKHSHTGLIRVCETDDGIVTEDRVDRDVEENGNMLQTVYHNGTLVNPLTFDDVRDNFARSTGIQGGVR